MAPLSLCPLSSLHAPQINVDSALTGESIYFLGQTGTQETKSTACFVEEEPKQDKNRKQLKQLKRDKCQAMFQESSCACRCWHLSLWHSSPQGQGPTCHPSRPSRASRPSHLRRNETDSGRWKDLACSVKVLDSNDCLLQFRLKGRDP